MQFDTQASDGVISGMSFEQAIRPYKAEDVQLTAPAPRRTTVLRVDRATLSNAAQVPSSAVFIAVGEGTESIEIHQIAAVDAHDTVTLATPLTSDHATGEWAGTEFVQSRWYPDVQLDNIFWHDHVDGIHTWGHGLVGQLIVEPRARPTTTRSTGDEVDSGTSSTSTPTTRSRPAS